MLKSLSTANLKKWTESPESDAVLLECDDPTGTNAVDDSAEVKGVEVKVMSPTRTIRRRYVTTKSVEKVSR